MTKLWWKVSGLSFSTQSVSLFVPNLWGCSTVCDDDAFPISGMGCQQTMGKLIMQSCWKMLSMIQEKSGCIECG
jgi:hypothetical protein